MKKLALLLTLCLVVTMLPGIGYSEEEMTANENDVLIEEQLPEEELELDMEDGEALDEALPEGDLEIDLGMSDELLEIGGDVEEAASPEEEGDLAAGDAGETATDGMASNDASNASKPHVDPDGPQLEKTTATVAIDDFFYLNPTMPDGSDASSVDYMSSNSAIAKVYKSGRVTGVSEGFACITAAAPNGKYSECFVYVKKAPELISFGMSSLTLGVGEEYKNLQVTFGEPAEDFGGTYTLTSENTNVVKVRSNGTVKAEKTGSARLKVETFNGLKGTLKVTVKKKPDKVTLSVDKDTVGVGETGKVSYKLPKKTGGHVTYVSKNPDVVSVDSITGEFVGLSGGEATIVGTTYNKKTDTIKIKVKAAPTSISFPDGKLKLGVGMSVKGNAELNEGASAAITYTSADPSVVSCSGETLKGVGIGKTVLTASTANGLSASCEVEVVEKPTSVTLPYSELNIGVKESFVLEPDVGDSASTFTYSSSKKKYVTVDKNGKITGVKKGSSTITVKTYNNQKVKIKVNVVKAAKSVKLKPSSLELEVGESRKLTWSFSPKGTKSIVTFSSSDPDIASVDPYTGEVTGVSGGKTTINAITAGKKKAHVSVTVKGEDAPTWVKFAEDYAEIGVKQTRQLKVEMSTGKTSSLKYSSADSSVATVSGSGEVTGKGVGVTTITVTTSNGSASASMTVSVFPAPDTLTVSPSSVPLDVGESVLLIPEITPSEARTDITYTSSAPNVASVSEDGMLTAYSGGEATVTVSTSNGLTAKVKVTVNDPYYPESAKLTNAPSSMKAGESIQLKWKVTPSESNPNFEWKSSNEDVAVVDDTGMLYAIGAGSATITAKSRRNTSIVLSFKVSVEGNEDVVLTIPERITGTSGISSNLKKIDAIRACAISQIDALKSSGKITSSDASKRKRIVNNAFKDYAFPWMTKSKQLYWKKENSEGGAKDFKTGKVYYGVPYMSGSGDHREYNVAKLLDEGIYYDSGDGYYILNQKKFSGRNYYGNDCSCFVDAAIWGTNSSHSNDRTGDIAKSSAYKTIKSYDNLRTGDLICKGGNHVVMFLYYANAEKTKIMIIENGGIEPGTNTVHCMIMNVKWYTSRSYKIRRLESLG